MAKEVCDILEIRTNTLRTILDSEEISTLNLNDYTIDIGLGNVLNKHTIGIDVKTVVPEAYKGGKESSVILVNLVSTTSGRKIYLSPKTSFTVALYKRLK